MRCHMRVWNWSPDISDSQIWVLRWLGLPRSLRETWTESSSTASHVVSCCELNADRFHRLTSCDLFWCVVVEFLQEPNRRRFTAAMSRASKAPCLTVRKGRGQCSCPVSCPQHRFALLSSSQLRSSPGPLRSSCADHIERPITWPPPPLPLRP